MRRTTASSQTTIGTTCTTSSSPSTTPMTTLTHCTCTSTDAWRTCTETARIFVPQSVMIHAHLMAQVLSVFHLHGHPWRTLLDSTSPFSSTFSSCLSPSSSSTSSCSVSSSTRRHGKPALLRCKRESEDTLNAFTSPASSVLLEKNRLWPQRKPAACGPMHCPFSRTSNDYMSTFFDTGGSKLPAILRDWQVLDTERALS